MTYPAQLRALAEFLEEHPDLVESTTVDDSGATFHLTGRDDWQEAAAAIVAKFGHVGHRQTHSDWLVLGRPASRIGEVSLYVPRFADRSPAPEVNLEGILGKFETTEEVVAP